MRQISNFSENASIHVVGTRGANDVHFILSPGRQSAADIDVQAVWGGDGVTIFDEDDWWFVLTDEVYVYDYEDNLFDDWFVHDLSLHCIPFLPISGSDPPWQRGYAPAASGFSPPPLSTTGTFDQTPTYVPDRFLEREIDTHSYLFGRFVRTKHFISVRADAMHTGDLPESEMLPLLPIWKEEIELVWSGKKTGVAVPPSLRSGTNLLFEIDWLNTTDGTEATSAGHGEDHYTVLVSDKDQRESMFTWNKFTSLSTAAHEYGHFIGLDDGYVYDGELPWFRRAVQANQIPIADPNIRDFLTGFGKPLYPWVVFQGLWNKERVEQRVANFKLQSSGVNTCCVRSNRDIMEGRGSQLITPCMITAIDKMYHKKMNPSGVHETQPICWNERLFK
ncbi:MAG: hypothetical protein KDB00_01585 [Planctomycetales bacterium]|nr:hypothetical protein [Planctomycetales bacterium]